MDRVQRDGTVTAGHTATRPADMNFTVLGSFLAARRAEVTPQQVGLPSAGPRRLSGLRREEVAMLAGIGSSWYTWIEQGRAKNVSPNILTAIADVLGLDETQRRYMMRLAGYAAPARPRLPMAGDRELGLSIVDSFLPYPAYFMDCYWDIVEANSTAVRLLGIDEHYTNYLDMLFNSPQARNRFPCWEQDTADTVARFRAQTADLLGDPRLNGLIARLRDTSPEFATLWDRHHVSDEPGTVQALCHPELGRISLTRLSLDLTSRPGLQLVLLRPRSDSLAERIDRWAGGEDIEGDRAADDGRVRLR